MPQLQFPGAQPSCVGVRCSVCVGMGNLQMLAHAPPPPQSSSSSFCLHISWFSLVPVCASMSPSTGHGCQGIGRGWNGHTAWGEETRFSFRSALPWWAEVNFNREKERSTARAPAPLPGDAGLCALVMHTSPSQHAWILVPLVIPLSVKLQLGKGRCQEQSLPSSSGQYFWDTCIDGWVLHCVCTCKSIIKMENAEKG